jgi:hypothetical protein
MANKVGRRSLSLPSAPRLDRSQPNNIHSHHIFEIESLLQISVRFSLCRTCRRTTSSSTQVRRRPSPLPARRPRHAVPCSRPGPLRPPPPSLPLCAACEAAGGGPPNAPQVPFSRAGAAPQGFACVRACVRAFVRAWGRWAPFEAARGALAQGRTRGARAR